MESVTSPAERPEQIAVAFSGDLGALVGEREAATGSRAEIVARVAALEAERHPRWVWWAAADTAAPLVRAGIRIDRCWDVLEVHRLVRGGWHTDPTLAWADARGLDPAGLPRHAGDDLFDLLVGGAPEDAGDPDAPVRPDGYLRPDGRRRRLADRPGAAARVAAALALRLASLQQQALATSAPARVVRTAHLGVGRRAAVRRARAATGLPIDRPTRAAHRSPPPAPPTGRGPRPRASAASATRPSSRTPPAGRAPTCATRPRCASCSRRWASTSRTPGRGGWSRSATPTRWSTRCSTWRKAERIATTYGYGWLDEPRRAGRPAARRLDAPATAPPGG